MMGRWARRGACREAAGRRSECAPWQKAIKGASRGHDAAIACLPLLSRCLMPAGCGLQALIAVPLYVQTFCLLKPLPSALRSVQGPLCRVRHRHRRQHYDGP